MNNNELNNIINSFMSKNGFSGTQATPDKNREKAEKLMKNLNADQTEQLKKILSDPKKSQEILNSPAAQALIKKLSK